MLRLKAELRVAPVEHNLMRAFPDQPPHFALHAQLAARLPVRPADSVPRP